MPITMQNLHVAGLLLALCWQIAASPASPLPKTLSRDGDGDQAYETQVRTTLAKFHVNLSQGRYRDNGPLVTPALEWNVDGQFLLGRANFVNVLGSATSSIAQLQALDRYHIVDGNVGAILFTEQGTPIGPFAGVQPIPGRSFQIMAGELMVYSADAELDSLITVEELGLAAAQLTGRSTAPNATTILVPNPQTPPPYRQKLRETMAALHANLNAGQIAANAQYASATVGVNSVLTVSQGPQAFVQLLASHQDAFPDLLAHDNYVLADGRLGAIEYVWQGTQTGPYTTLNGTILPPSGNPVRVREFLFFEFDDEGLITVVTDVHDEAVIERQLSIGVLHP